MKILPVTSGKFFGGSVNNQQGQALLIILLMMSVVLTIVLSTVTRSITDVSVTEVQEDSVRAFDAAEAGVERSLITLPQNIPSSSTPNTITDTFGDSSFNTSISVPSAGQKYLYPTKLLPGEIATFWFVSQDRYGKLNCAGGKCLLVNNFDLDWGNKGTSSSQNSTPAIELSIYYDSSCPASCLATNQNDYSQIKVRRYAFDPNIARFGSPNAFDTVVGIGGNYNIGATEFQFKKNIQLGPAGANIPCYTSIGCIIMIRARILYNYDATNPGGIGHYVGIEANNTNSTEFPAQGVLIDSSGRSGDSQRKVNVFQTFAAPPFFFDASVFSQGGLVK